MRRHTAWAILQVLVFHGLADAGKPDHFQPVALQLYYGDDAAMIAQMEQRMARGDVVVVETRALAKPALATLIGRADQVGAKVLAYISIGELHDSDLNGFREFLAAYPAQQKQRAARFRQLDDLVVRRNAKFHTFQVDVLAPAWRDYVMAKVERLYKSGVHGLFLDTVDTVDLYIVRKEWSLSRRVESVQAMIKLIRTVKSRKPAGFILQNRGLNLIGRTVFVGNETGVEIEGLALIDKHRHNPDGVLWENAFAGNDPWTIAKQQQLRAIRQRGHVAVFALGYKETFGSPTAFFERCLAAQFIPAWATSSTTLHRELAIGKP